MNYFSFSNVLIKYFFLSSGKQSPKNVLCVGVVKTDAECLAQLDSFKNLQIVYQAKDCSILSCAVI